MGGLTKHTISTLAGAGSGPIVGVVAASAYEAPDRRHGHEQNPENFLAHPPTSACSAAGREGDQDAGGGGDAGKGRQQSAESGGRPRGAGWFSHRWLRW